MDLAKAQAFLEMHHRGVLATRRRSGAPQLTPVMTALDGEGRLMISTRETAIKTKNVRRDPHVSVCVFNDGFFGEWIRVDGTAEVVSLPEAMDLLVDYYRRAAGEHPDWDDYRAAMAREQRVMMIITIDAAGPDRSG
jgi:PPOX class probable F420-dependent enzyme